MQLKRDTKIFLQHIAGAHSMRCLPSHFILSHCLERAMIDIILQRAGNEILLVLHAVSPFLDGVIRTSCNLQLA